MKKEKKSWSLFWKNKGKNECFDPVALIGYDKAINVSKKNFVNQIIETVKLKLKLSSSDEFLEVGCGAGMLLIPLSKITKTACGVDLSLSLVNKLRKVHPELKLFLAEANNLPFEDQTYDKVLVHSVFHYFPSFKYSKEVIFELLRICRKSGLILIMDIPDVARKKECIKYMSKFHPKKYADKELQHLFYSKKFFEEIFYTQNLKYEIFDQNIIGYSNSGFRFNVLIKNKF